MTQKARSPIEMMIDKACGYDPNTRARHGRVEEYADLCVKAADACERVNPSNPLAVAEGIDEAFEIVNELAKMADMLDKPGGRTADGSLVWKAHQLRARIAKGETG